MKKRRLFLTLILILQSLYFLSCDKDGIGGVSTCETRIGQNPAGGTLFICAENVTGEGCYRRVQELASNPLRPKVKWNANSSCPTAKRSVSCTIDFGTTYITTYLYRLNTNSYNENRLLADAAVAACEKEGGIVQRYIY